MKYEKLNSIDELQQGDIVRHRAFKELVYMIHANYGGRATGVRIADITNPHEWEILKSTEDNERQNINRPRCPPTPENKG